MGEGSAARGGVAELLALVAVGDALVDGEDVPGVELSTRLREISQWPNRAFCLLESPTIAFTKNLFYEDTLLNKQVFKHNNSLVIFATSR